jgi:hypothetical protein
MKDEEQVNSVGLRAFISITTSSKIDLATWKVLRVQIRRALDIQGIGRDCGLRVDLNLSVTGVNER